MTWLAAFALIAGLFFLGRKIQRERPSYVRRRTDDHEDLLAAMHAWVEDPLIVGAAYEAGVLTVASLRRVKDEMGHMTHGQLRAVASRLQNARRVRQMTTKNLVRNGAPKKESMDFLRKLAEEGHTH